MVPIGCDSLFVEVYYDLLINRYVLYILYFIFYILLWENIF